MSKAKSKKKRRRKKKTCTKTIYCVNVVTLKNHENSRSNARDTKSIYKDICVLFVDIEDFEGHFLNG